MHRGSPALGGAGCSDPFDQLRTGIATLYSAGLRRSELVTLDLEHYDAGELSLTIRASKGRKDRITYVEQGAADAIADWLYFRDEVPGPLFTRIDKGDRLTHARLTPQAVYYILGVRCEEADVDPLSPHDFRRTFVSDLLDASVDLATVSRPVLSLPPVLSSSK